MNWQRIQRFSFIVFVLIILTSIVSYYVWGDEISLGEIKDVVKDIGVWTPLVFILAYFLATIFIPSTPLMAISAILFGFKMGFIYSTIGGILSAIATFYISRILGKEWVENILAKEYLSKLNEYNKKLESGAVWDIIIFRNIPIMPFNALNILLGISRVSLKDYTIGSLLGLIPSTAIGVYLGILITKIF